MAAHNETGKRGEEQAEAFLRGKGYIVLEKNWRCGYLEVDLICMDGDRLVLVEVKTRADLRHGTPEASVTRRKERHLIEAAEAYLERKNLENEVRFDIVGVREEPTGMHIHHIAGAFTGMG